MRDTSLYNYCCCVNLKKIPQFHDDLALRNTKGRVCNLWVTLIVFHGWVVETMMYDKLLGKNILKQTILSSKQILVLCTEIYTHVFVLFCFFKDYTSSVEVSLWMLETGKL